jgi:hypothetical protein
LGAPPEITGVRIEGRVHAALLSGTDEILLVIAMSILVSMRLWHPDRKLVRGGAEVEIRSGRGWAILPRQSGVALAATGDVPIIAVRQPPKWPL